MSDFSGNEWCRFRSTDPDDGLLDLLTELGVEVQVPDLTHGWWEAPLWAGSIFFACKAPLDFRAIRLAARDEQFRRACTTILEVSGWFERGRLEYDHALQVFALARLAAEEAC